MSNALFLQIVFIKLSVLVAQSFNSFSIFFFDMNRIEFGNFRESLLVTSRAILS